MENRGLGAFSMESLRVPGLFERVAIARALAWKARLIAPPSSVVLQSGRDDLRPEPS
jgi:hypothetical protein